MLYSVGSRGQSKIYERPQAAVEATQHTHTHRILLTRAYTGYFTSSTRTHTPSHTHTHTRTLRALTSRSRDLSVHRMHALFRSVKALNPARRRFFAFSTADVHAVARPRPQL